MSEGSDRSGYVVSGAMHFALLALVVFGFGAAPRFDDATESIPVETITQTQLNQIMKGERDAKPVKAPSESPKAAEAAQPTPPTPPEPPPDLREADAAPPKPAPPPPPKPAPPPPPPPPRPVTEDAPEPPVKTRQVELPPEKPREPPPERPEPPKREELVKLLAKEKAEEPAKAAREALKSRPKSYDPSAIARMLGETKTADARPTAATARGLPTAHAARMSPSLAAALDAWFTDAYLNCWSPPPTMPEGDRYIADVHVVFNPDGSLSGPPVLDNPPRDPAWRAHADSAIRAVLKCNPLRVPPQYAPFFEQWKTKTIHFDPQSALG